MKEERPCDSLARPLKASGTTCIAALLGRTTDGSTNFFTGSLDGLGNTITGCRPRFRKFH
ncbi:hypothetical protein [Phenylobacterium montanum]|uniref:Uncharacterized protein n=1 Tax=Phenylobacterium montanum TaxID=2823693 RepID=A0A975FVA8_9CAUL|nr:hypothetical protein [Caulobacter sp. S6]QUD85960.1 hypothetical protein KCG34_12665 [Caulobacter sp. S6]